MPQIFYQISSCFAFGFLYVYLDFKLMHSKKHLVIFKAQNQHHICAKLMTVKTPTYTCRFQWIYIQSATNVFQRFMRTLKIYKEANSSFIAEVQKIFGANFCLGFTEKKANKLKEDKWTRRWRINENRENKWEEGK